MNQEKFYSLLNTPTLFDDDTITEIKELIDAYPYFQAAWILYLKWLKTTGSSEFNTVLEKVAPQVPDRKKLYLYLNTPDDIFYNNSFLHKIDISSEEDAIDVEGGDNNLIDKFLTSEIKRFKPEREKEEEERSSVDNDLISRSTAEDDDLITETLALIYKQQKKYDRAIDAFKKLSLKYPEKSIYFADQINQIQELKNN